jgi:hypothetical protein
MSSNSKAKDVNQYFDEKYGTHDLATVQAILERGRASGTEKQPVIVRDKLVEVPHTPEYIVEALETAEEKANRQSSEERVAFLETVLSNFTICTLQLTDAELQSKAEKWPVRECEAAVNQARQLVEIGENFKEETRKLIESTQRSLYDYPDQPEQARMIKEAVEASMKANEPRFQAVEKGLPHFKRIVQIFEDMLVKKKQEQACQREKAPQILKEMGKLSKDADKRYERIVKLSGEYQQKGQDSILDRLSVVVVDYERLEGEWLTLKSQLRLLDPMPTFPAIKSLPPLPDKLWRKVELQR